MSKERNCENCYYHSRCKTLPFNGVACDEWRPYMLPRRYLRHLVGEFSTAAFEICGRIYDDEQAEAFAHAIVKNEEYWEMIIEMFEREGFVPNAAPNDTRKEWYAKEGWKKR